VQRLLVEQDKLTPEDAALAVAAGRLLNRYFCG
jgi:hypothetical protein